MKITSAKQFEMLVAELEKKPFLARGFARGITPANFKSSWEEITVVLNSSGTPSRDSDGWQKVWRDLKFKVKKKLSKNKAEMAVTGGGRNKQIILTDLEEAVASLLNFDKQINPSGRCFGFPETEVNEENELSELMNEICSENIEPTSETVNAPSPNVEHDRNESASTSRTPRRKKNSNKKNLLEKHSDMQKQGLSAISASLKELKNYSKDAARYARKQYELAARKAEREEKLFEMDLQIKRKNLQLLERQLM